MNEKLDGIGGHRSLFFAQLQQFQSQNGELEKGNHLDDADEKPDQFDATLRFSQPPFRYANR